MPASYRSKSAAPRSTSGTPGVWVKLPMPSRVLNQNMNHAPTTPSGTGNFIKYEDEELKVKVEEECSTSSGFSDSECRTPNSIKDEEDVKETPRHVKRKVSIKDEEDIGETSRHVKRKPVKDATSVTLQKLNGDLAAAAMRFTNAEQKAREVDGERIDADEAWFRAHEEFAAANDEFLAAEVQLKDARQELDDARQQVRIATKQCRITQKGVDDARSEFSAANIGYMAAKDVVAEASYTKGHYDTWQHQQ